MKLFPRTEFHFATLHATRAPRRRPRDRCGPGGAPPLQLPAPGREQPTANRSTPCCGPPSHRAGATGKGHTTGVLLHTIACTKMTAPHVNGADHNPAARAHQRQETITPPAARRAIRSASCREPRQRRHGELLMERLPSSPKIPPSQSRVRSVLVTRRDSVRNALLRAT